MKNGLIGSEETTITRAHNNIDPVWLGTSIIGSKDPEKATFIIRKSGGNHYGTIPQGKGKKNISPS